MTIRPPKYGNTRLGYLIAAIAAHDSNKCLLWPFAVDRDGYGKLTVYENGRKITVKAHRVAFKMVHGKWPVPIALHSCDNPACFNPRHISEGDNALNQQQKVMRGRSLRGVMQHKAKLTEELVVQARAEYARGNVTFKALSLKYGVNDVAMRWAVTGIHWAHVPGAVLSKQHVPRRHTHCKRGHLLTPDNVYVSKGHRACRTCNLTKAYRRGQQSKEAQ